MLLRGYRVKPFKSVRLEPADQRLNNEIGINIGGLSVVFRTRETNVVVQISVSNTSEVVGLEKIKR